MPVFMIIVHYTAPLDAIDRVVEDHRRWVDQGYEDGLFLLSGPQNPRRGGAILAHGVDRAALEARLAQDPFAIAGVARHEVIEVVPRNTDPRLDFLRQG